MATTEQVARDLLASMNTDAGFLNAIIWIDNRYKELCTQVKPSHLREIGEVIIPKMVSTGTVASTRDATGIAGSSTAWLTAPCPTTASDDGGGAWYFRDQTAWYNVATFDSSTSLTLSTTYAEDGGSSRTYDLVKRFHTLSTDTRWLGDFMHTRRRTLLETVSIAKLNRDAPDRTPTGSIPFYVADAGLNSSGERWVEIYPYPTDSEIIHYVYWTMPTSIAAATTTISKVVDPYILKEGALIDLYRYMKADALMKGNVEAAAVFRNDEHAQRTVWKNYIKEARRADRAMDDTSFILVGLEERMRTRDIMNARDIVLDRWNWP